MLPVENEVLATTTASLSTGSGHGGLSESRFQTQRNRTWKAAHLEVTTGKNAMASVTFGDLESRLTSMSVTTCPETSVSSEREAQKGREGPGLPAKGQRAFQNRPRLSVSHHQTHRPLPCFS